MKIELIHGDCLEKLKDIEDCSVDSIITDPPYGISFMGKKWDYDIPSVEIWEECLRVLKPGGHLLAFAGTKTQHRMCTNIEDAGFEIRDMLAWVYGSGFPKSLDVSKAIDKMDASEARLERQFRFTEWVRSTGLTASRIDKITGTHMGNHYTTHPTQPAVPTREIFEILRPHFGCDVPQWVEEMVDQRTVESENFKNRKIVGKKTSGIANSKEGTRHTIGASKSVIVDITTPKTKEAQQWDGWGTSLKPALEPITLARKTLEEKTVADNVLKYGTGAINIKDCRISYNGEKPNIGGRAKHTRGEGYGFKSQEELKKKGEEIKINEDGRYPANFLHDGSSEVEDILKDKSRFFYCAKASKKDRDEWLGQVEEKNNMRVNAPRKNEEEKTQTKRKNNHPTVKPTDLMRYLCRLITPPGGTVLDPFMGSGSTGKACVKESFNFIGIEREEEYFEIAKARINNENKKGDI